TKVFKSNRSQAVRLPKAVAFPEFIKDVEITAIGNDNICIQQILQHYRDSRI
ncbi:MAG: AbrB/MazE/SpoVT family DNA-binding domain-containing protein, partial [Desulfobacula sp.]|nr:AbrB/MazE/SpoVT family DNA-binding domain-containing protein [Desulfobacula sp.]